MNKIGFKNFRKFRDFPELELGNITYLVGQNNSGKSTLVKALLLVNSYLKSGDFKTFSFGNNVLHDANIVTWDRALNIFAQKGNNTETIEFTYSFSGFNIAIEIIGELNKVEVEVNQFVIGDPESHIVLIFNPLNNLVRLYKWSDEAIEKIKAENEERLELEGGEAAVIQAEIRANEELLASGEVKKRTNEYLAIVDETNMLRKKLASFYREQSENSANEEEEVEETNNEESEDTSLLDKYEIEETISFTDDLEEVINQFLQKATNKYEALFKRSQKEQLGEELFSNEQTKFENYRAFYLDRVKIEKFITNLKKTVSELDVHYLSANPSKQTTLFSVRDTQNALAQAIHDYKQLKIQQGDVADRFVKKWMKEFDVGDDFEIDMIESEAYTFKINTKYFSRPDSGNLFDYYSGKKPKEELEEKKVVKQYTINLADKGMGSIQAMLLIMRLAAIIRKSKSKTIKPLVLIEEPELNLHPMLQSKLCDLFYEVYEKYGIHLVVETHSEYIIRRTQVLFMEEDFNHELSENPFRIYYFSKNSLPYQTVLQKDGTFDRGFGTGFSDEASKNTIALIKLNRNKTK